MKRYYAISFVLALVLLGACATTQPAPSTPAAPEVSVAPIPEAPMKNEATVVTLASPSPLISIKIMVRAGSTADPDGREGLANIVSDAIIEGGYGDPANPVTKEKLAEITQPWGAGAMPRSQVSNRTTTFHLTVPRDVLDEYMEKVLRPMFMNPLFTESEIDRLKTEANATFAAARFEDLENLGLASIDAYVNQDNDYAHQPFGSEEGVAAITRDDVVRFFTERYRPGNMILGVSTSDTAVVDKIASFVNGINAQAPGPMAKDEAPAAAAIQGRHAVVIEEPNAPAASIHLGIPLAINRTDPDFWPLYVAHVHFGIHRDGFGVLYQEIRQERGYNYGDYAYLEHWNGRPFSLFQVFNQPREQQYFSIWVRPIGHEYAHHITKAITWELDNLIRQGLTEEELAAAKNKAKVLYVNLAETVNRLLSAKLDDAWYGMEPGYLDGYIDRIDAVTADEVNAALRRHLQTANMKYVLVTDAAHARDLVARLEADRPAYGKSLEEYQVEKVKLEDGTEMWQMSDKKVAMLRRDGAWAHTPLDLDSVRLVLVTSIFRTGKFIGE